MKYNFNKVAFIIIGFIYTIAMIGLILNDFFNNDISLFIVNRFQGIGLSGTILFIGGAVLKIIDFDDWEEKLTSNGLFTNFSLDLILLMAQILFSFLYNEGSQGLNQKSLFVLSPTLLILLREYFGKLNEIKKMLKNKE